MPSRRFTLATLSLMGALALPAAHAEEVVNIYSSRGEGLIKPLLDRFSEQTGISVNLVTGKAKALMKRLESEGRNTPADVLLTVDAGNLYSAKAAGYFQPIDSESLTQSIPAHLRDVDNQWFGLSQRSRVVVYKKGEVSPEDLSTYEDLASEKWQGKICIRSSNNIYNQSLMASLIVHDGEENAESWAKGVVSNMARSPKGNDRAQIKAVAAGECQLAVVNTYYMGKMLTNEKDASQVEAAQKVAIFFPNQDGRGAHMNVGGAGVVKSARNKANAVKLIEYLASEDAQKWYAEVNHEYPVREGVAVSEVVKGFGYPFKQDTLSVSELGTHNAAAVKVFDRAGWK